MRRWRVVRVQGPSMVPTLRSGDILLVRDVDARSRDDLAGQVVVGRFRSMPGRSVVKRADSTHDAGWLLRSDNPFAGGDSAVHGVADVEGRAVLRWQPGLRPPRRVRPAPDMGRRGS